MTEALTILLRLWLALMWLGMALIAGVLLLVFWPFVRQTQGWPRHRRGIAPPARDEWRPLPPGSPGTLFGLPIREVEEVRLMPPVTDTCGCCGQDCPPGAVWCLPCGEHVSTDGPIEERTYVAQYGRPCPYQSDQQDYGDCSAPGLGPRVLHRTPSPVTPHAPLDPALDRALAELARGGPAS